MSFIENPSWRCPVGIERVVDVTIRHIAWQPTVVRDRKANRSIADAGVGAVLALRWSGRTARDDPRGRWCTRHPPRGVVARILTQWDCVSTPRPKTGADLERGRSA